MSNERVQYFILTKFNQYFNFSSDSTYINKNNSCEWLDLRFKLFEEFCFPSVLMQTNQDFLWIVFFSHDIPSKYQTLINGYKSKMPNFVPVFTKQGAFKLRPYLDVIENYLDPATEVIFTTRLDSDDALNRKFVEIVRNSLVSLNDFFIDCPHGVQYDLNRNIFVELEVRSNPFLTRVERLSGDGFKSVLSLKSHVSASEDYPMQEVSEPNMWMQVIHGQNLLNSLALKSNPLVRPAKYSFLFSLRHNITSTIFSNFFAYFRYIFIKIKLSLDKE